MTNDLALAARLAESASESLQAARDADDDQTAAYHRREAEQAVLGLDSVLPNPEVSA